MAAIAPANSLEGILNKALDDLQAAAYENANSNQGTDEEALKVAKEAFHVIASLKLAYEPQAKKSYQELNSAMQENVDRIQAIVSAVLKKDKADLSSVDEKIQALIQNSPLGEGFPYIREVSPQIALKMNLRNVREVLETEWTLLCKGHFPEADDPKLTPHLALHDQIYKPAEATKRKLKIKGTFKSNNPHFKLKENIFLRAGLHVPSSKGGSHKFELLIQLAPIIVFIFKATFETPALEAKEVQQIEIDLPANGKETQTFAFNAAARPGEHTFFVPESLSYMLVEKEGNITAQLTKAEGAIIEFKITRNQGQGKGKLKVSVDYMLKREAASRSETVNIGVGEGIDATRLMPRKNEVIKTLTCHTARGVPLPQISKQLQDCMVKTINLQNNEQKGTR